METLCEILVRLLDIYTIVIFAAVLASWLQMPQTNPVLKVIHQATEPVYEFIRRFLPTRIGPIDIAPVYLVVAVSLTRKLVNQYGRGI